MGGRAVLGLGETSGGDVLHFVEVEDGRRGRVLRAWWEDDAWYWISITGPEVETWSADLGDSPEKLGEWLRAFVDGTYSLTGRLRGLRFTPERGGPFRLHARRHPRQRRN